MVATVVRASARGILKIKIKEAHEGSAPILPILTKDWSRYLLERMQFVRRKANTKASVSVENFLLLKHDRNGIIYYAEWTRGPTDSRTEGNKELTMYVHIVLISMNP